MCWSPVPSISLQRLMALRAGTTMAGKAPTREQTFEPHSGQVSFPPPRLSPGTLWASRHHPCLLSQANL